MTDKMFYVWVFKPRFQDYVPVAVFNTNEEAAHYLERLKRTEDVPSGAILEDSFADFAMRAAQTHLGKLYEPISALANMLKTSCGSISRPDGRIIKLYGIDELVDEVKR